MNPYVALLAAALKQSRPDVETAVWEELGPRRLWLERNRMDVLHLHWPELLYASATRKGAWLKWLRFVGTILLARLIGVCLVYTVHNLAPHEGQQVTQNRLAQALLFLLADVIHVHDDYARRAVGTQSRWLRCIRRCRRIVVIPHGNYLSYPNTCPRQEARERLGIPQGAFVYLVLGQLRPYKGIEELLEAFGRLPDRDVILVIVGHVHDPAYGATVEALAAQDERVMARLAYVPPEELQYYFNACDICVLPYRHVTTSGAAILAFSFGKPVLAPRLGGFPELVGEERGLLYDPDREDALRDALRRARRLDLARASAAAWSLARELDWVKIARQHLRAYEGKAS